MKSFLLCSIGLALICSAQTTTAAAAIEQRPPNRDRYKDEQATPTLGADLFTADELAHYAERYDSYGVLNERALVFELREPVRYCEAQATYTMRTWGNSPVVKPLPYTAPLRTATLGLRRNREYRSKSAVADEANQR